MRILFIAGHEFLYNPQNGGQKCSFRNYEVIKNIVGGENMYLCLFSNFSYRELLENTVVFPTQNNAYELLINTIMLRNVCSRKSMKKMLQWVEQIHPDVIFIDSSTIGYLAVKIRKNIPKICFLHNIERNYALNKVKHDSIKYLPALYSYWLNEKLIMKKADKIVLLNERDSKLSEKIYGRKADFIWPITFYDTFSNHEVMETEPDHIKLLFVGSLFGPNVDGITWFINQVMSKLSSRFHLYIVGKDFEKLKERLERENVIVIGTVEEVDRFYYMADAVVLPVFWGDGMKVKTAEAMMYGKTLFASGEALTGYYTKTEEDVYVCNNDREFISNIENYFLRPRSRKYSHAVRKRFLENFESSKIQAEMEEFLYQYRSKE